MTASEIELKGLMHATLHGDAVAYHTFLTTLSVYLRAYYQAELAKIGQSPATEHLVRETLSTVHSKRHTYCLTKPLTPWLNAIARYKLTHHLHQLSRLKQASRISGRGPDVPAG